MTAKIEAVLLPDGEQRTLYIADGRWSDGPHPDAVDLGKGFVLPGLVDSHTHADFPQDDDALHARTNFVRGNLADFAGVGTVAIRDMGASSRTLEELERRPGEPRIIPAGESLIGCKNHCFPVTSPDAMIQVAVDQVKRGVTWVKIFADWPDPSVEVDGKATYFRENNPLTYTEDQLRAVTDAIHRAGGKVAAHVFTEEGARVCVEHGADTIEHGWGITEEMFDAMIAKNIAWVPLVGIAEPMTFLADRDGRPDQRAWIEACLAQMSRVMPAAARAGVTLLTGTDWFPAVTIAHEAAAMAKLGVPVKDVLAAASTNARRYHGLPGIEAGAPADLALYRENPMLNLSILTSPDMILIEGEPVQVHRPGGREVPGPMAAAHG